jgi:hypothetical protein
MKDEERPIPHLAPPSNVANLRLPGATPPEAHAVALERIAEALILSSTISRQAADAYMMALKVASVSAPFGENGAAVSKIIANLTKRLETHLATLPNHTPPSVA